MTIALSANTPRVSYTVSQGATQTSFAVPFVFFTGSTDLNVFVDNTERTFDASTSNTSLYTVSGGSGSTGTVTTSVTGATGGSTVVITRAIPLSRTTDFPSSGAFEISKLNTELDTITAIQSDFNDSASRAIRLQDSDSAVSMELPLLASRKGTVLGFNATTGAAEAGPSITAVQTLADVTASINLLGTSAVVEDMGLLATSANITAMGILGTSSNVTAMGLLGNSATVADMALLGTSDVVADMALLATTDVIADMNTLATSDIISDLNTLATSDIVTDMNLLATSDNVTAMGVLGTSANVTNMATLGASGVVGNIATVAGVSSNVTTVAGISSNVTTVAGISSNVTTVAGVASNVTTVANNVTGVNSFAERYRVASSAPSTSLDVGDLYFDTTANELKVYKSSGWAAAGSTVNGTSERFTYNITGTPTTLTGASGTGFAEANSQTLAYDAGFIDVYLNGVKMVNGTDVTVTSGTSVVFASALSNGDVVDIVTFGTFNVANIVSTGALNSGSITSGFGNIDIGSSTITTTGAITGGSLVADNITIDGNDISSTNSDGDIVFKGSDGGSTITALTLDMSDAGTAIFNHDIKIADNNNIQFGSGVDLMLSSDGTNGKIANLHSNGDIIFEGNDGGSTIEAMRIDMSSAGKVGIGTTSPGEQLHVNGTSTSALQLTTDSYTNGTVLKVQGDGASYLYNTENAILRFGTNNLERMRIHDNGNISMQNTDNQALLKIFGHLQSYNGLMIQNGTNNTGGLFVAFRKFDNVTIGSVSHSGSGSSVAYNTTSDYRLKENVSYNFDATSRLKQLKPARFNWIADEDNTTVDGFLAHEVSDIVPEAITGTKDDVQNIGTVKDKDGNVIDTNISEAQFAEGKKETVDSDGNKKESLYQSTHTWEKTGSENVYQQIDQAKLVPLLVKTIQELEARITALESA